MSNQEAPRVTVQGVQVLLLKNSPYIEVAERVRSVHRSGKALHVERGEVLEISNRWIYRAYITLDGQQYIGDAEIHFGAPPNTPDGTNPITCGQTSAVGNALTFAGFGNLKSVLARLGLHLESEHDFPSHSPRRSIQDIDVVMFDEQPYVDVAERIYFVHLLGKTFSIQHCEVIQYNKVWIYRAFIMVDNQLYIGDAEIYFDALQEPDKTYPISCGQTSAIGNALAFAGFGDVRSILERWGKEAPDTLEHKPVLASANAISRARQRAFMVKQQEEHVEPISPNRQANPTRRDQSPHGATTPQQRERIHVLCERLGEAEPNYATMTGEEADILLAVLTLSEQELLLTADTAIQQEASQGAEFPQYASREAVGILKDAWLEAYRVTGTLAAKRGKWTKFKYETCRIAIDDTAIRKEHYDQLLATIVAEQERHASTTASDDAKAPQVNGHAH